MDFTSGITYAQDQEIEFLNEQLRLATERADALEVDNNQLRVKLAQIHQIAL